MNRRDFIGRLSVMLAGAAVLPSLPADFLSAPELGVIQLSGYHDSDMLALVEAINASPAWRGWTVADNLTSEMWDEAINNFPRVAYGPLQVIDCSSAIQVKFIEEKLKCPSCLSKNKDITVFRDSAPRDNKYVCRCEICGHTGDKSQFSDSDEVLMNETTGDLEFRV